MGLSQKYPGAALITGASSGIGKAFAERLAAEGMDLVLVARRTKRLQSIRLDLASRFPVRVDIINADLIEPLSTEYILEYLDQQQISVSMLFNNAGISHLGPFATSDIGIYERMVSLHCTAPVRLTHAILNRFPESLKAIITTSSLAGILPTPYLSVYSATKAFLTAWSYTLSEELSEQGIAVLSLNPGGVNTEILDGLGFPKELRSQMYSPDTLVSDALHALEKGRLHVITKRKSRVLTFLSRFVPKRMILKAAKADILKYYDIPGA